MHQIAFEGVIKSYRPGLPAAVEDLSFTVQRGEIYTLLGPSGCGKTTTLRLVAGFEKPDRGRIVLAGNPVAGRDCWVPPEKRGVGMVFQNYALFPHLTIEGNVSFGLKRLPGDRRQGRVKEFLHLVGLSGYEKRYPHELSGGQQQRVALARALCPGPLVVLLDEPFSNLDTELREQMRDELKRIMRETGSTAVLVTHDQKDALAVSDRIMVMRSGASEQVGDPRSLYLRPASEFVAAFLGKSNVFSGRVAKDRRSVETEVGRLPWRPEQGNVAEGAVTLCVRPEGFELAEAGPVGGRVKGVDYLGSELEVRVEVPMPGGRSKELLVKADPRSTLAVGEPVSLRVRPEYVAVIS